MEDAALVALLSLAGIGTASVVAPVRDPARSAVPRATAAREDACAAAPVLRRQDAPAFDDASSD